MEILQETDLERWKSVHKLDYPAVVRGVRLSAIPLSIWQMQPSKLQERRPGQHLAFQTAQPQARQAQASDPKRHRGVSIGGELPSVGPTDVTRGQICRWQPRASGAARRLSRLGWAGLLRGLQHPWNGRRWKEFCLFFPRPGVGVEKPPIGPRGHERCRPRYRRKRMLKGALVNFLDRPVEGPPSRR